MWRRVRHFYSQQRQKKARLRGTSARRGPVVDGNHAPFEPGNGTCSVPCERVRTSQVDVMESDQWAPRSPPVDTHGLANNCVDHKIQMKRLGHKRTGT